MAEKMAEKTVGPLAAWLVAGKADRLVVSMADLMADRLVDWLAS